MGHDEDTELRTIAVQALDSAKSAHHRLNKLEEDVQDIHTLAQAMAATQEKVTGVQEDLNDLKASTKEDLGELRSSIREDVGGLKSSVDALTSKPGKFWDKLVLTIITALVSGLIGYALSAIISR